jgi:hypothetical protein
VFNGATYLVRALESLLIQSYEDFGLVFVDNCSTDETPAIAHRYAELDPRLAYQRNDQQLGLAENWRRSFDVAVQRFGSFEYFCWGSDHDIWHPSWLEALVGELDADPELVGAFPLSSPISADGEPLRFEHRYWDTTGFTDPLRRLLYVTKGVPPRAGSVAYGLFRADALRRCGVYLSVIEPDTLLLSQLALLGPMKQVPRALWQRRFFGAKPTRHRQRSRLYLGRPPLHAYLPVPVVHSAVLLRWAVMGGSARPHVGRLRGAAAVFLFLPLTTFKRLGRISRRRRKAMRRALSRTPPLTNPGKKSRDQRRKRLESARRVPVERVRRVKASRSSRGRPAAAARRERK